MYGTVARMKGKPGTEGKFRDLQEEYEAMTIPGFISSVIYRMDNDANEYYLAVVFDSKESYIANAQSPEQNTRYLKMRELLASDPEWHDGEIVYGMRRGM
jgi:antibiotic biosynthesis monooxygenase (ABM) superfamily enzyme